MSINSTQIEDGVSNTFSDILGRYNDSEEINDAIFGDLTDFNLDGDIADVLQNYVSQNTSFWDKYYLADPSEYVKSGISDFALSATENALESQKGASLTVTSSIKALSDIVNQLSYGMSVDDIRALVNSWDMDVGSGKLILYSGGVGEVDTQNVWPF